MNEVPRRRLSAAPRGGSDNGGQAGVKPGSTILVASTAPLCGERALAGHVATLARTSSHMARPGLTAHRCRSGGPGDTPQ